MVAKTVMSPLTIKQTVALLFKKMDSEKKRKRDDQYDEIDKKRKFCSCEECVEERRVQRAIQLSIEDQKRG